MLVSLSTSLGDGELVLLLEVENLLHSTASSDRAQNMPNAAKFMYVAGEMLVSLSRYVPAGKSPALDLTCMLIVPVL